VQQPPEAFLSPAGLFFKSATTAGGKKIDIPAGGFFIPCGAFF
jgi:hypothetical protein